MLQQYHIYAAAIYKAIIPDCRKSKPVE